VTRVRHSGESRNPVTDHLDLWTSALLVKSTAGRGSNGRLEAYGIKRLRELILELAVRGKLVPQDASDEPASELLKRIAREKKQLIAGGLIKQEKLGLDISKEDKPYLLPTSWQWARLPEIASYKVGKTPSTKNPVFWSENDEGVPWVSISDMEHFGVIVDTSKRVTRDAVDKVFGYEPIPKGSLLMSFKLTVGKIAILDIDAYHNEAIISLKPYSGIVRDFLFKVLPMRAQSGDTKRAIMGDTLNASSLSLLSIPIPPVAEQRRIVAKVDELMVLCDQLERQQGRDIEAHQTLVETLLGTLTRVESAHEFAVAWNRIAGHFDTLFITEHSIDQLKQTVLQLAVMGKVVPQDSNDEPVVALLSRIKAAKERIIAERQIRQLDEAELSQPRLQFNTPKGWAWVHVHDVAIVQGGKRLPSGATLLETPTPHIYIRVTDMKNGTILESGLRYISSDVQKQISRYVINKEDLYITIAGTIGDVGFIPDSLDGQNLTENAAKLVFRHVDRQFLQFVLTSDYVQMQFLDKTKQMAQPKLALKRIAGAKFCLPPLPEQHRIVAKVDELMTLCDALKVRIAEAQAIQIRLADAIVERAVS